MAERGTIRAWSSSIKGFSWRCRPLLQPIRRSNKGAAWLCDIAYILEPTGPQPSKGAQVAKQLRGYLDTLRPRPDLTPTLGEFGHHLDTVSRSDWPGLFHCYDVPGLPRTNNEIESRFRDISRHLLRMMVKATDATHAATPRSVGTPAETA